jgi:hypothetical protein
LLRRVSVSSRCSDSLGRIKAEFDVFLHQRSIGKLRVSVVCESHMPAHHRHGLQAQAQGVAPGTRPPLSDSR